MTQAGRGEREALDPRDTSSPPSLHDQPPSISTSSADTPDAPGANGSGSDLVNTLSAGVAADDAAGSDDGARAQGWLRQAWASFWPEWTTRDMGLLLAARAAMSAARALAGVVVPIYLAILGYSAVTLGLLFTVVALTSAALTALVGLLSDRLGRKFFIVMIPWLAALVFAFSRTEALLIICAAQARARGPSARINRQSRRCWPSWLRQSFVTACSGASPLRRRWAC